MKKILILIVCLFAFTTANAESFRLNIITDVENDKYVIYDANDWTFVQSQDNFDLYLNKGELEKSSDGSYLIHTMTVFKEGRKYEQIDTVITNIFSYGILECSSAKFYLLGNIFTDATYKSSWIQTFDRGAYISHMETKNTAREAVYYKVCKAGT
jgi:hypothetical protein